MKRREFITLVGGTAAAWPLVARAQDAPGKVARVGIIDNSPSWDPFRQQLRELNYVEGQNITYVYLRTDGSPAQLEAAAAALVQLPVNVIVAFGTPRAQAAQRATKTIPIVAISIGDPIAAGLVTSLAHPVGNITGNTILGPDIVTKKLQILKDAFPAVARVAYLWNPDNSATAEILEDLRKATPLFQMTLTSPGPHRSRFCPGLCPDLGGASRCGSNDKRSNTSSAYAGGYRLFPEESHRGTISDSRACRRRRANVLRREPSRVV